MNKREKEMLLAYLLNEHTRKQDDLIECQNRMRWRRIDEVDCVEMTIAIARLKAFEEFQTAVLSILKCYEKSDE